MIATRLRGWLAGRNYEPEVDAALRSVVRPGAVCVDAGAYRGTFSILMARLAGPEGHVYAFEPHARNAARLRRSLALRRLGGRVTVEEAALVATSGEVGLFPGRSSGAGSEWTIDASFAAREDATPVERRPELVRALALDDYLRPEQPVDVVKIDVEGAEGEALEGMRRILREHAPVIVLEFHREAGWPAILVLRELDYSFCETGGTTLTELASADDVPYHLVARRTV